MSYAISDPSTDQISARFVARATLHAMPWRSVVAAMCREDLDRVVIERGGDVVLGECAGDDYGAFGVVEGSCQSGPDSSARCCCLLALNQI